jgi:glycine oxidase
VRHVQYILNGRMKLTMGCGSLVVAMREEMRMTPGAEIAVAGAGIIGLSVALELQTRGAQVVVLERAAKGERVLGQASWAAAGMLAADDPYHPPSLRELSRWSASLYDGYLDRISALSGVRVRYQTERTLQYLPGGGTIELHERSLDPRELMSALRAAAQAAGVRTLPGFAVAESYETSAAVRVGAVSGAVLDASMLVRAEGAWMRPWTQPRKGQMLRVRLSRPMDMVYRAEHVYVVPRTSGVQTGTALIGATVEDAGMDVEIDPAALDRLRSAAAELVPEVWDAEPVEAWAGLRPATASGLPILSAVPGSERQFVAAGHFRNGILLAPGSAVAIADLMEGKLPAVDLESFDFCREHR